MKRLLQQANFRPSGNRQSPAQNAEFQLLLKNLEVGRLRWDGLKWMFTYSEEFMSQDRLAPITDFPDTNRSYVSKELWPFFALRIPSQAQEAVKQWMSKQDSSNVDDVTMLQRFGGRTATNPLVLKPSETRFQ